MSLKSHTFSFIDLNNVCDIMAQELFLFSRFLIIERTYFTDTDEKSDSMDETK